MYIIYCIYLMRKKEEKRLKKRTIIFKTESMKDGNVLFNDALNTFYLLLYGIGHMDKDHSLGYSFQLAARDLLCAQTQIKDSTHHEMDFATPVV